MMMSVRVCYWARELCEIRNTIPHMIILSDVLAIAKRRVYLTLKERIEILECLR